MAFLSLYRKYRPNSFADLVGQKNVIRTLKNALNHNRITHAYLFAGPRGTGKTSTAKIYAQALNCINGPTLEPCGECEACQKIQSGQSIDVIEIDAASNRGIDEIRDLREKVKFYPSEGKYKVYIIDEVHMLTTGAFNALLKTLEEPPENVVFILATTEPHKVIDTIHSRCQRFDFSLLSNIDIMERLEYICNKENVQYDQQSLNLIATASNGGLRDAISLLDQAISFTNSKLESSEIQEMLGKVDITFLQEFMKKVCDKNSSEVLEMFNDIINSGKGISIFVDDLINFLRQVMLYKECGNDTEVFSFTNDIIDKIEVLANRISTVKIIRYLEILTGVSRELTFADQPRIILELGIIKMVSDEADNSLQGLRSRIAELEYKVKQVLQGEEVDTSLSRREKEGKDRSNSSLNQNDDREKAVNTDSLHTGVGDNGSKDNIEMKAVDNRQVEKTSVQNQQEDKNDSSLTFAEVEKAWPLILSKIKEENISVHAMLMEGKPEKIEKDLIYLQFPEDKNFHRKGAERQSSLIQKVVNKVLGVSCQLQFINHGKESEQNKKKISKIINSDNSNEHINTTAGNNGIVERVVKAFNGEIIKVNHHILVDK